MKRRNAIAALGVGTIVAPLSGCLDFAGMRPGSDGDNQDEEQDDAGAEGDADGDDRDGDRDDEPEADDSADGAEESDETEDGADDEEPLDPDDVEQRAAGEDVLEFGGLQIIDYEERVDELEHGDEQISYTGEVENVGDEAYESVMVEVRVYGEGGEELGNHQDLTPELGAGETWRFEIAPHSRPEEIADHDIAVVGE